MVTIVTMFIIILSPSYIFLYMFEQVHGIIIKLLLRSIRFFSRIN